MEIPDDQGDSEHAIAPQVQPTEKKKRQGRRTAETPEETSVVRRSTRSNKYDGFKQKSVSDAKPIQSKVKPRKVPKAPISNAAKKKAISEAKAGAFLAADVLPGQLGIPPPRLLSLSFRMWVSICVGFHL